jgi:hypothetical protein
MTTKLQGKKSTILNTNLSSFLRFLQKGKITDIKNKKCSEKGIRTVCGTCYLRHIPVPVPYNNNLLQQ